MESPLFLRKIVLVSDISYNAVLKMPLRDGIILILLQKILLVKLVFFHDMKCYDYAIYLMPFFRTHTLLVKCANEFQIIVNV